MNIQKISCGETIDFAALELRKYLLMMMPLYSPATIGGIGGIKLGLIKDFNLPCDDIKNELVDDVIYISTDSEEGIIAGSNPRSVLFAVYEYLKQNGCRWLFPGTDGEFIPIIDSLKSVKMRKKANKMFRGQCIEGAVTQDNVLSAIDFAPKIGLNSYMLECENPFFYYDHWYRHPDNKSKIKDGVSQTTTLQWKRQCETEIKKRGLLYHDVGHGFTMAPFGINILNADNKIYDDCLEYVAMIDGKRGLFKGKAINTNFCMSNIGARERIINYIVDYCKIHTFVDYLHFWFADGANNNCECPECVKKDTADWYIILLNELDQKLCSENIDVKIVFILYRDLIWPPKEERINNPERFTMLFAPIYREYSKSYAIDEDSSAVVPYKRNRITLPVGMDGYLAYLKEWQKVFDGDCFAFEYHFYSVVMYDPSNIFLAKCVYDDVRGFDRHSINGVIEDQSQRNAFPTGFPIYTMAKALFDNQITFEEIKNDYFYHAFGNNWKLAYKYLEEVSRLFDYEIISSFDKSKEVLSKKLAENMDVVISLVQNFKDVCKNNIENEYRCRSVSWKNLYYHCEFCKLFSIALKDRALGRREQMKEHRKELLSYLHKIESEIQPYEDVFLFYHISKRFFNLIGEEEIDYIQ